jgi:hypothetical protein
MTTRRAVLAICSVIVFTLAVTQAPAVKKHKHATIQVYRELPVSTPAGQVGSGTVFCPGGTLATGGGEDWITGLATVDMGFAATDAYYVLVDNFNSTLPSQMNVQVACTAGTAKARGRTITRAQVKSQVEAMAEAREEAHRAAGD